MKGLIIFASFQAIRIIIGWLSLVYAWGLEVKDWFALIAYLVIQSSAYPVFNALIFKPLAKTTKGARDE